MLGNGAPPRPGRQVQRRDGRRQVERRQVGSFNKYLRLRLTRGSRQRNEEPASGGVVRSTDAIGVSEARPKTQTLKGLTVEIIGVIIAGIIIGLLGKFFAPGNRDNIPLWLTVLCGIGGVLIGYYVAAALGVEATKGIDWIRWIISIIVAAILVMIAATVTGRSTSRRI